MFFLCSGAGLLRLDLYIPTMGNGFARWGFRGKRCGFVGKNGMHTLFNNKAVRFSSLYNMNLLIIVLESKKKLSMLIFWS